MMEFFMEGGWGMWPILFLGLVTVGAAVRFAMKPERQQLGFLGAIGLATLVSTIHATWTDFAAVANALSDDKRVPDADYLRVLTMGFKESTRPGTMGGGFLVFACILVAVGVLRMGRKDEKEA